MGLKIGITTNVVDSAKYYKGVANYVKNLVINLANVNTNHNFYLVHFQEHSDEIYQLGLDEVIIKQKSFLPASRFFVSFKARKSLKNLDIIHISAPRSSIFPLYFIPNVKKVLTVHSADLYIPPQFKVNFLKMPKAWIYQELLDLALPKIKDKVDMYITVSQFMKRELVEDIKIPEEKIRAIHSAANERFKLKDIQKSQNFILSDTPIPNLIKIYFSLRKKGIKHKLLIFSMRWYGYKEAEKIVADLGMHKDVLFLGWLSDEDLVKLYNTADVYVRISEYEGFGIPALEAMACGCPVITSNAGSLPEVVGDAGITKDLHDLDGLTEAIYEVLTNEGLKQDMAKKGLERVKMFSWEKTAKETIEVYEEVGRR